MYTYIFSIMLEKRGKKRLYSFISNEVSPLDRWLSCRKRTQLQKSRVKTVIGSYSTGALGAFA